MRFLVNHLFFFIIIILIGLMVATSYYRFMVVQDYIVGYEGECDPYLQTCYVYCEDEECTEPFYYSWIERHAGMIYETCGGGLVTECDDAYVCANGDDSCAIYFCDPEFEECETLTEANRPSEIPENTPSEEASPLKEVADTDV